MKRLISTAAALAAVAGFSLVSTQQAHAATAPIWCGDVAVCQKDYVYPTADHQGYWMIRRFYEGERWWRATLVAGWNNTYVAPITCENAGACVVVYYDAYQATGYYMARRWNDYAGEHWVRLTEV
jgi:regulator of RNase E activity RraA